jgi:hypothetical protein
MSDHDSYSDSSQALSISAVAAWSWPNALSLERNHLCAGTARYRAWLPECWSVAAASTGRSPLFRCTGRL